MPRISDLPLTTSVDEATALIAVSSNGTTYKITPANLLASSGVGVSFYDSDSSHLITLAGGSNLSANRTLTLTTGDSNRTLDISAGDTTISAFAITILDDANAAAVRSTLGLGSMALETATDYLTVASAVSGYQPLDADLTTLAASITAFGHSLVDDADAAAARTTLGLGTAATQNTGTSGATIPLLNGANTWSGQQIIDLSASSPLANGLVVQSTEDSASGGPGVLVRRISASPAASDQLGFFQFQGRDSGGNNTIYASVSADIIDPTDTSEDGSFSFNTIKAGTVSGSMTVRLGAFVGSPTGGDTGVGTLNAVSLYENGTLLTAKYGQLGANNTWTGTQSITTSAATAVLTITSSASFCLPFTLISTNDDALAGPGFQFIRQSATPAASDLVGFFNFRANNSALSEINFSQVLGMIHDPTAASEDGGVRFNVMRAGAIETAFHIKDGVYVGAPTGFAQGVGTLNAVTLYENGTALTAKYGQLAVANTWSAAQTISSSGGNELRVLSTTAGVINFNVLLSEDSATAGPYISTYRNSASPAASDQIGVFLFRANNSTPAATNYAALQGQIIDPTAASEDGRFDFQTVVAGALATRAYIQAGVAIGSATGGDKGANTFNVTTLYENGTALTAKYGQLAASNTWTTTNVFGYAASSGALVEMSFDTDFGAPLGLVSSQASANPGPNFLFRRISPSVAASDLAGQFLFQAYDNVNTVQSYGALRMRLSDIVTVTLTGRLEYAGFYNGSYAQRGYWSGGLVVGSPTSGDLGTGTFNAVTIYENGTSLAAKYAALGTANTFTNPQRLPSYTVAGLPAGAAGDIAFTSNGRKNGEGAGAGTGVLVFHDGTAWRACDTGATVAA